MKHSLILKNHGTVLLHNRIAAIFVSIFLALTLIGSAFAESAGGTNLIKSSDDLSRPEWKGFSKNASVEKSDVPDPDGNKTAFRLKIDNYLGEIIPSAIPGHRYLFSAWMKSATGKPQSVRLTGENNAPAQADNSKQVEVTDQWQRFFVVFDCPAQGNFNFRFSFRAGDILVWHPQVEDVTGKDPAEPGPYVENPSEAKAIHVQIPTATPAPGVVQNISCWGDSLTAGAGGKPFTSVLQKAASIGTRKVFNGGVGGQTSSQIKERFLQAPDQYGDIVVIWAGRNNYQEPYKVEADIAEMVSKLKTNRFLVLSVLNMETEGNGTGGHSVILDLNHDLAAQYPDNFLDIRNVLVEAYDKNSPEDLANHTNDVPPKSLRSDKIHLNDAGYALVGDTVLKTLEKKWLNK